MNSLEEIENYCEKLIRTEKQLTQRNYDLFNCYCICLTIRYQKDIYYKIKYNKDINKDTYIKKLNSLKLIARKFSKEDIATKDKISDTAKTYLEKINDLDKAFELLSRLIAEKQIDNKKICEFYNKNIKNMNKAVKTCENDIKIYEENCKKSAEIN